MYAIISAQASDSGIRPSPCELGQKPGIAKGTCGIPAIDSEGNFHGDIALFAILICGLYHQVGAAETSQLVCGNARHVDAGNQSTEIVLGKGFGPFEAHIFGNEGSLSNSGVPGVSTFESADIILDSLHSNFEYANIFFYNLDIFFYNLDIFFYNLDIFFYNLDIFFYNLDIFFYNLDIFFYNLDIFFYNLDIFFYNLDIFFYNLDIFFYNLDIFLDRIHSNFESVKTPFCGFDKLVHLGDKAVHLSDELGKLFW